VIVDVEPELYFTSAGFTGRLDSRLRLLRAIGANELRVYLGGATVRRRPDFGPQAWPDFGPDIAPGAGHESDPMSWHVAVGAGVLLPRGRAPDVELVALVGTRGSGVSPGARVSWAESLVGGLRVDATAGFEPFRVDVHPLRLAVGLEFPVATGRTVRFDAVAATLDPSRPTAFALRSSLRMPTDLR